MALFGMGDDTQASFGNALQAIGAGLLSGDRYNPIGPGFTQSLQANAKTAMPKAALKALLLQEGATPEQAETYSANEKVAQLALASLKKQRLGALLSQGTDDEKAFFGGGASNLGMGTSPAAPPGPAAGASLNGNGLTPPTGNTAEIQNKFVGALKDGGLTNPFGLGAVAAYAQHESRYSPQNIVGSWSDPSESGQAGTSGGILSWRDDRLAKMRAATAGAKDPVVAQAQFTLAENPELTAKLQNAKSAEEANALMADAWKFAGYNRQGGEYANRLATTQAYANRFGQTRTADASGAIPQTMPPGASGLNPGQKVDVANNENDAQVLEGRMGMYPPNVYGVAKPAAPPANVASAADLPTPDAKPAGFVIPGQNAPAAPSAPSQGPSRELATRAFRASANRIARLGLEGDDAKGAIEAEKAKMAIYGKYLEPTEIQRNLEAAGLAGTTEGQQIIRNSLPDSRPGTIREFEYGRNTPGFEEYQKRMKEAGRSQVNIDQRGEGKFEEGLAAASAKRFNEYIEQGDKAKGTLADIGTLRQTSRALGSLGKSAEARATLGPYLESLGVKVDGLSDIQLFNSTVDRLAPQLREPGTGATSDRDLAGFTNSIGRLSNTPEAREKILDVFEAAARNKQEAARIATDVSTKKITRSEGEDRLRALPDPLTAFREYRKANPDPGAPQQQGNATPPAPMNTTDRAMSLRNARDALAKNPGAREMILKRLKDAGLPTEGL